MEQEMATISKDEYDTLLERDFKLTCLENFGVNNWDWYSEALVPYYDRVAT